MNTQFRLSVLTTACLSITYSSIALAETASENETKTLATIVVTASREGESINNTPAAISKISSQDIDDKHATFIGQLGSVENYRELIKLAHN